MFGFPPLDYSLHLVQLPSLDFLLDVKHMKLCVIYEESTLFVRHIGLSVVKRRIPQRGLKCP